MASSIFTTSSPPSSSSLGAAAELAMLEAYPTLRSYCAAPGSSMDALRSVLERRPAVAPCNTFKLSHVHMNLHTRTFYWRLETTLTFCRTGGQALSVLQAALHLVALMPIIGCCRDVYLMRLHHHEDLDPHNKLST